MKLKNFKLNLEGKTTIVNTLFAIPGGMISFYIDRGNMHLGTIPSLGIGLMVLLLAAYTCEKLFKENDYKWYLNQGAFVYILVWLVVNGILTTF